MNMSSTPVMTLPGGRNSGPPSGPSLSMVAEWTDRRICGLNSSKAGTDVTFGPNQANDQKASSSTASGDTKSPELGSVRINIVKYSHNNTTQFSAPLSGGLVPSSDSSQGSLLTSHAQPLHYLPRRCWHICQQCWCCSTQKDPRVRS